jgi:hypothetical protein
MEKSQNWNETLCFTFVCFATWLLHKFSTGSFSDLIKAGDSDHVFDFFTNIEPTLVGGKKISSPFNSEGSFFSLGLIMQVITMLKQDTVCPNFSQKKAVLQNYLTQHNIPFSATDTKKVLYEKIKQKRPQ